MNEVDRNASPSAYGWVFQVGAGITLMLDHVKSFKSLKMEGKSDDIEISFDTGKIYAQAKSVTQIGNQKNATRDLNDALKVLSDDCKNNDALKLIYITNIANPLSSRYKSAFEYEHLYDFSVLPEEDQKVVKSKVSNDFPVDKFQVYILRFFGEGNNKFSSVQAKMEKFLREALHDQSFSDRILNSWFKTFMVNCSDKPDNTKSIELNKRDIFLPVIALVMDNPVSEEKLNKVYTYDDYDELIQKYRSLIDRQTCNYEFYSSVMGSYMSKIAYYKGSEDFKYIFVYDNWKQFEEPFCDAISDIEEREALVKLIMLTIIEKRRKLHTVREAIGL